MPEPLQMYQKPPATQVYSCTCGEEVHLITDKGLMCGDCFRITPFDEIDDILPANDD